MNKGDIMTTLTFYSGMRTIGGTVIAIEHNNHRLIFDFGYVVNSIFDDVLGPRPETLVQDALRLNALPKVDGIFSRADLGAMPIPSFEEDDRHTAFFISHMHLDHMASIGLLAPQIPIYVSPHSKKLYEALVAAGEGQPGHTPNLIAKAFDAPFTIGDMTVTLLSIDHDVVGASGLKVDTPDGTIVYTGDYRFHGHYPEKLDGFIQATKDCDVLITEGVTVSFIDDDRVLVPGKENPEESRDEYALIQDLETHCHEQKGLLCLNIYNRNIHRLEAILDMMHRTHRTMVLTEKTATLLKNYADRTDYKIMGKDITVDTINETPGAYMLQTTYETTMSLLDMNLKDALYIHSNGVPLGDYDPAYGRLLALLETIHLPFLLLPCGGHAHPDQLQYMIEAINPKTLVPYHSFAPERLVVPGKEQVLPEPYSKYHLEDGQLGRMPS